MRKMKKHRIAGIVFSMFLYLIDFTTAQENFEDADKLSDLMSASTEQHFDLRHTIPGTPEVDYPIYSEVPKTSFECTGRHEGYYADIESRCQSFHICTHTARSVGGFGFLCPNGTLFSQKHFVCDWYRNVNCNDSERYYSKNDANRIGSSLDMLETVRQIMEYPMKKISKALQQNPGSSRKPAQRHRNSNRAENQQTNNDENLSEPFERNSVPANSARKSVTRAQVESVHSRGSKKYDKEESVPKNESYNSAKRKKSNVKSVNKQQTRTTTENSSSSSSEEDVFVNSLGELSTDPGVKFNRTNAHVIAEPRRYRYQKNNNHFAQKVNSALNDLADLSADEKIAPDYVKEMRASGKPGTAYIDLASNINGLLDEAANDLNPNTSGYQAQTPATSKHSFRFLSRGFSSQNDPYKYQKPKQTASTIRFTPNQLPLDDEKENKKPAFEIADDAVGFGQSTTTSTTTTAPSAPVDILDYLQPPLESPNFDETPTPDFEETSHLEFPLLPPAQSDSNSTDNEKITTTTAANLVYTVTPSAIDMPIFAASADTATTESQLNLEASDVAKNLVLSQQQQLLNHKSNEDEEPQLDADRLGAHKQAENLFFSGLQLTANENETETSTMTYLHTPLLIQVPDDHSYLTAGVTSSTVSPTLATESLTTTTTETSATTEISSLQARIRNYRRLTSLRGITPKPVIYGKHGHLRIEPKLTTKTSTTPKTTRTTKSYLKRVAASRLRLSRLAALAGNKNNSSLNVATTTAASVLPVDSAKLDQETAISGNSLSGADSAKIQDIITLESVRNSLQRFQINRENSNDEINEQHSSSNSPSPATVEEISTTARSSLIRTKNRFSNFKIPAALLSHETTNSTDKPVSSTSSLNSHTNLPLSFLNSHLSRNDQTENSALTVINSIADNPNLNSNSALSSVSPTSSDNFIPFDKLTRSIFDDSILQNYRAASILGRSSLNTPTATNVFQARSSTSSSDPAFNAYQAYSRNANSNQIFAKSAQQNFAQIQSPATSQLTLPQRTAYLPFNSAPTTPGPRVVIAHAKGQRIEPNSVSSIISSLITQQQPQSLPKPIPTTPYVPLNDFLTRQFGNQPPTKATEIAATYQQETKQQPQSQYQQNQQHAYHQLQARTSIAQQYQIQHPSSNQYHQESSYRQTTTSLAPPQPTLPTIYTTQNQQHLQFNQQLSLATPSLQPLVTRNIFATYQKQQQQLPQFPPLGTQEPIPASLQQSTSTQSFQKLSPQFNDGSNFLNIQLPSLNNGLIPAPTAQTAQKRSDIEFDNLKYNASPPVRSIFMGDTSYDVPLNSIGRLPNDITALFRRLRRY